MGGGNGDSIRASARPGAWGRVAQASDLAGITGEAGAPSFAYFFCEGRESEMPAPNGFDHVSTTKSNSTRSIASHPCKKRKDGAPSVEMVHTQIAKDGPPARDRQAFQPVPASDYGLYKWFARYAG
jgi:hypothetical protein